MSHSAYPASADLQALLTAAGLTSGTSDLAGATAEARAEFERGTGRTFLPVTTTLTFDPPSGRSSVVLVPDLLTVSSVTFQGRVLVSGTDYRLLDPNAAALGKPYRALQLTFSVQPPFPPSYWSALSITGSWGYGTALPDDVWTAMLYRAAVWVAPEIALAATGGTVRWSEAGVSEDYGTDLYGAQVARWQTAFDRAVERYRRVVSYHG